MKAASTINGMVCVSGPGRIPLMLPNDWTGAPANKAGFIKSAQGPMHADILRVGGDVAVERCLAYLVGGPNCGTHNRICILAYPVNAHDRYM